MTQIQLAGGKYTLVHDDGVGLHCLRHGAPWRNDLAGDGMVLAAAQEIETLREALSEFCDRVEKGEVRSVRTYQRFCDLLSRDPAASLKP